ncbi:MAG: hypothetical protein A3B25_01255 [Candidatus Ryanbacteria bacterium RIFCSPLOWO2_01_FULL_48_26]|uniref:DUF8128 domain-containing protein n=1 Tax=Candidatus Ryanbacteria bacterium RIFCSPLOWO2_01_FULL_48_26 TaxID=1802126 RepID=A0A1G2GTW6_9BACT|nr:MAG: hypothetical protein A3B25_01255 [Candidatus Ryanbacteria bacterium RIFCSPLOWO2_01_FULL_48_26]
MDFLQLISSSQDLIWLFGLAAFFAVVFPLAQSTWLFWKQEEFKEKMPFILVELRMPREVRKSPRAMEQILSAIHALRNFAGDFGELWIDGEITRWYSLEMVSFGGEVHFYLRMYKKQRDLIEAAFYSYYPDIEIIEVEDYTKRFPKNVGELYQRGYDMWGSELMLVREAAYPIKSYLDFEAVDEEKQYDPISLALEVLGKIKTEEIIAVQILIEPASHTWKDEYKELVEKLRNNEDKQEKASSGKSSYVRKIEFEGILPHFPIEKRGEDKKDDFGGLRKSFLRTPGETDVLTAVEENLSKPAFETIIRFIYFSPKELFYDTFPRRGIMGIFNQYSSSDLNSFIRNEPTATRTKIWHWPHIAPASRNEYKKQRLMINYRHREMTHHTFMGKLLTSHRFNFNFKSKKFIMSNRSIATIFHPPTFIVLTAPHIKRVESRKMGPPAGLPIYGGEEDIQKYK